jgi:hypothetical protein
MHAIGLDSTWYYQAVVQSSEGNTPPPVHDWADWQAIRLPHLAPLPPHYNAWYATEFVMPPNEECSVWWLEAEGIEFACQIWLNGQSLGSHWGGFTRFRLEVTHAVHMERNLVVIRVEGVQPGLYAQLKTGQVPLVAVPEAQVGIWGAVRLTPYDCQQPPQAEDWYLPPAEALLKVDRQTGQWWREGNLFFPRGCTYLPTPQMTESDWETHIELAKAAHLNILRVSGQILSDDFYSLCDEKGLFIWQDLPLDLDAAFRAGLSGPAIQLFEEMIAQLRHHPCIAVWGLLARQHNDLTLHLMSQARQMDSQRHIEIQSPDFFYEPIRAKHLGLESLMPIAFGFPSLSTQVVGNEVAQQHFEAWRTQADRRWLMPTEVSDLAQAVSYSQERQALLVKYATEQYRLQKGAGIIGVFHHTLADGLLSLSPSLIDEHQQPKLAYAALQSAMKPVLPIADMPFEWLEAAPLNKELSMSIALVNDLPRRIDGWSCNISMTSWLPSNQNPEEKTFMFHWKHRFQHIKLEACSLAVLGQVTIPPMTQKAPVYQLVLQFFNLHDENAQAAVNTYLFYVHA